MVRARGFFVLVPKTEKHRNCVLTTEKLYRPAVGGGFPLTESTKETRTGLKGAAPSQRNKNLYDTEITNGHGEKIESGLHITTGSRMGNTLGCSKFLFNFSYIQ